MHLRRPGAAVFLDRDGTLIRDVGYLQRIIQIELLPRVPEALCLLHDQGFKLVMVTNQSAIARGWLSEHELAAIHSALSDELERRGACLDAVYYCPHHPTEGAGSYRQMCSCRKPGRGMIDRAVADLGVDPSVSYVVGDQGRDIELARSVGAIPVLIRCQSLDEKPAEAEIKEAANLWDAALWIIEHAGQAMSTGVRA